LSEGRENEKRFAVAGEPLAHLVEMGGVEPPSRTASRKYPTRVAGDLRAGDDAHRQASSTVSQIVLGGRALAD
jgi:hypothetical protein